MFGTGLVVRLRRVLSGERPPAQDMPQSHPERPAIQQDEAVSDPLQLIYADFLDQIAARSTVLLGRWSVNNSDFMPAIVRRYGVAASETSWIARVRAASDNVAFGRYANSFVAALLSVAADDLLAAGRAIEALALAEEAMNRNRFDLWAQRVLLNCRASVDGEPDRVHETEEWLSTRFCPAPFDKLETTTSSEFIACCSTWLPVPLGDFSTESVEQVFQSPTAHLVRESILDKSFRYCSRLHCPWIAGRHLPAASDVDVPSYQKTTYPREVTLSHDPSCNLSCPSCRTKTIVVPKREQVRFDALTPYLLPLMIHADMVHVCGSGDPFASIHFRNLLSAYGRDPGKHRNLRLATNGVLCDERAWTELGLGSIVKTVMLSLDAATEETYAYTRRGGDWARVLGNIAFLSSLMAQGVFEDLQLLFVVQARNFEEMPRFVELGKAHGVSRVLFQAISSWDTYSEKEFAEHNIFSTRHPRHAAFLEMLASPVFDDPIVDLHSVALYRRSAVVQAEGLCS